MANKALKSIILPGLESTTYTIPYAVNASGTTQTASTAVATAAWVSGLPKILEGTVAPGSATGTLKTNLTNAPNGSIYIMHT